MFGPLDDLIAAQLNGAALIFTLFVALGLGLRHATDPDHLVALSTLAATGAGGARPGARLGTAWGLGHATSLLLFGLPIILFRAYLPDTLQRLAESLVGLLIVVLAVRLLRTWRASRCAAGDGHDHPVARTNRQAFVIGVAHGTGGSAGVCVLLLAGIPSERLAVTALLVLAFGSIVSMAIVSAGFGRLLEGVSYDRVTSIVPVMAAVSLAFGVWYAATSWSAPLPFLMSLTVCGALVAAYVARCRKRDERTSYTVAHFVVPTSISQTHRHVAAASPPDAVAESGRPGVAWPNPVIELRPPVVSRRNLRTETTSNDHGGSDVEAVVGGQRMDGC